jgi:hypothetical protein
MQTVKKIGNVTIKKDGSFYRVYEGRKRIGSFLLLSQAEDYATNRDFKKAMANK